MITVAPDRGLHDNGGALLRFPGVCQSRRGAIRAPPRPSRGAPKARHTLTKSVLEATHLKIFGFPNRGTPWEPPDTSMRPKGREIKWPKGQSNLNNTTDII